MAKIQIMALPRRNCGSLLFFIFFFHFLKKGTADDVIQQMKQLLLNHIIRKMKQRCWMKQLQSESFTEVVISSQMALLWFPEKQYVLCTLSQFGKKNTISLGTKQNYHSNQKNNCQQLINIMMNGPDLNNFDFIETLDV